MTVTTCLKTVILPIFTAQKAIGLQGATNMPEKQLIEALKNLRPTLDLFPRIYSIAHSIASAAGA